MFRELDSMPYFEKRLPYLPYFLFSFSTGAGRTGVFIALSNALESLRSERVVDIYQIVKTLRHERPYMVQTLEQFEFCYRVASDFLKNFDFVV